MNRYKVSHWHYTTIVVQAHTEAEAFEKVMACDGRVGPGRVDLIPPKKRKPALALPTR